MEFFSFIDQSHLFNSRQIDEQVSSVLIILKLSKFWKKLFVENVSFTNFWFVGSRFMNHKFLIPTLIYGPQTQFLMLVFNLMCLYDNIYLISLWLYLCFMAKQQL